MFALQHCQHCTIICTTVRVLSGWFERQLKRHVWETTVKRGLGRYAG